MLSNRVVELCVELQEKVRETEDAFRKREAELDVRAAAQKRKEEELESIESDQASFKKVSMYNKLLAEVDRLKIENQLLLRSHKLRHLATLKSESTEKEVHDGNSNEMDAANASSDEEEESYETIEVKGTTYHTDGEYLYDVNSGEAAAYRQFKFYKKKK